MTPDRAALEQRWLHLTRVALPALATARGWPVPFDHCFQRILFDSAFGARWLDHVTGRPAYKAMEAGNADLVQLNRQSLGWRGKL